ncbi:type II toxin-antitoxin system HicB family antitoxin [Nostoc sp. FACHB-892]|jgi:predicted RNase H-like HicB family nuclease|nr:type II toxin-antitoxin system HicB family antitoxin [Nostoc sp. FACHB-892]
MKRYHINIFYSEEDDGYIVDIPDLKYCSAFGSTEEEALHEAIALI